METSSSGERGRPTHIGKYEVLKELGSGGMGVVYQCIDRRIGREVAIKTLNADFANKPEMLARFYEEGQHTGQLNHPNIVTVYDVGDENGMPYIVMECVDGHPLDKLIPRCEQMPLEDRLRIVVEICQALAYAHRHNVIHRDVKPANIFVLPDGRAKLLDFGIARPEVRDEGMQMTRTGFLIGTVAYMAPERLRGKPCDGRSDIFAMGIVLFELLTGRLPFDGEQAAIMQMLMFEPHPRLTELRSNLPVALERIVDRSLEKSPEERYSSGEEMAADLKRVIGELRKGAQQAPGANAGGRRTVVETPKDLTRPNSQLNAILSTTTGLVEQGKLDEALHLLKSQPEAIRSAVHLQEAIAAVEDVRQQAVYRTIGRAYASLPKSVPESRRMMHNAQTASDLANLGVSWTATFHAREQSAVRDMEANAAKADDNEER